MIRLMIMEDDVPFGFQLAKELQEAGYEAEICTNGTDAMEELLRQPYDVVISDMIVREGGKPVANGGITLLAMMRRNVITRHLPIIAMTGAHTRPGMDIVLSTAKQVGANAVLKKPFMIEEMIDLIERFTQPMRHPL